MCLCPLSLSPNNFPEKRNSFVEKKTSVAMAARASRRVGAAREEKIDIPLTVALAAGP